MARASGLGPESREFESLHSDHLSVGSVAASAGVCKTLTQKHRWFESTPADQYGEVTLMVRERFAKPSVAFRAWRFKSSSLRQHGWLPKWLYWRGLENRCGESPVGSNPTPSAICSSSPILVEAMASDTIKYRFESCLEHHYISFV